MKLQQLSVFLENKPHQLRVPSKLLAEAGINIITLNLADTTQFGILRVIVDDWQKAREVLRGAGCVVKMTEVLGIEVPDQPGGLDVILAEIEAADLNIEYMYSMSIRHGDKAVLVFRFEDNDAAIAALQAKGIGIVEASKLGRK